MTDCLKKHFMTVFKMRIVFIGCVEFSAKCLEHLLSLQADIVGVCTKQQSAFNADFQSLTGICQKHSIPCLEENDLNTSSSIDWIARAKPDVIFCFGWSSILKAELLNIASMGVLGYHPAKLPQNRGRHPIIWALVLGLKETASTFFFMDEGADSGPILSQSDVEIGDFDTAQMLYYKLNKVALAQITDFLPKLQTGVYEVYAQNHEKANYWRLRQKVDGQIDWRMSAKNIFNLVRGLSHPYPGAHFIHRGNHIVCWQSTVKGEKIENDEPGKIISVTSTTKGQNLLVVCGEGVIELVDLPRELSFVAGEYL